MRRVLLVSLSVVALLVGVAPQSVGKSWMVLGVCAALFVIFNVILFRRSIFRRKAVTK